jgi:tight adherence protein B
MHALALLLLVVAVFCLVYAIERQIRRDVKHYMSSINDQTGRGLAELFLFIDVRRIWPAVIALSGFGAVLTYLVINSIIVTVSVLVGALLIPKLLIRWAINRRYQKFNLLLPKALLSLSAMLKSGLNLSTALTRLETVCPSPVSEEISLLSRQLQMGVSFEQSFTNLYLRIPLESVMITTGLFKISFKTGGSLAQLLESHAKSLQNRQHQIAKADALTSQARLQAWVMGLMPIAIFFAIALVSPELSKYFYEAEQGFWVTGLIVFLDLCGILMIQRILRASI